MSSSSEAAPAEKSSRPQWLTVIAAELKLLVHEIASLGDRMSSDLVDHQRQDWPALQAFDLLVQKAATLADLLAGLEREGPDSLDHLIARIPFHEIRDRLARVAGHDPRGTSGPIEMLGDETEWF